MYLVICLRIIMSLIANIFYSIKIIVFNLSLFSSCCEVVGKGVWSRFAYLFIYLFFILVWRSYGNTHMGRSFSSQCHRCYFIPPQTFLPAYWSVERFRSLMPQTACRPGYKEKQNASEKLFRPVFVTQSLW